MRQCPTFLLASLLFAGGLHTPFAAATKPVRALIITGGCCHNYPLQTQQFTNAMAKLATVEWTVVMDGGKGKATEARLYDLAADLGESHDLIHDQPEKAKELQAAWDQWYESNVPPLWPHVLGKAKRPAKAARPKYRPPVRAALSPEN